MFRPMLFSLVLFAGCVPTSPAGQRAPESARVLELDEREDLPGGTTTVADASPTGLGRAAKNLSPSRWPEMLEGKRVFQRIWSASDAQGKHSGLGPLYNGAACSDCHFRDGRAGPPSESMPDVRLLARLAVPDHASGQVPEPTYGSQLSEQAVPGLPREGVLSVDYELRVERFRDGSSAELRQPDYRLDALNFGPQARGVALSARMPGALVGMGLLEAIPVAEIVARADPDDRDGDGISGRANWVPRVGSAEPALGRFGWKAAQPSVLQQIATAFREDMGLTSWVRPQTACTEAEPNCAQQDHTEEVSARELAQLVSYVELLGVPARRDRAGSEVRQGKQLFLAAGCASCHTPAHVTAAEFEFAELQNQTIFPYSDLLLHDMGAELADELSEFGAEGREWRTAPLWGLGFSRTIHGRLRLLHDGRARGVEEAILWHGGEAVRARENYRALAHDERQKLVRFVESL